ncbi:CopD family protein [Ehrlichia ruminantium]|uniref:Protoporphyrinogen IX oxidase n=1 Tax=Ehrlichia ruminantium TaxID=779 RepID=A0AAE6Q9R1_EHRRU|nr:CopD family protein [Ehrlichia ruminantium]QGR02184.1 CopD family protein [Ehrlichia ruminantium]QGR03105.1 CopD family protein [Ehrlichia ruminantium]QGR04030.1 CopD family protein [Ehrlichia ruminantium]
MIDYEHWVEAFHIISVIMWMAGMLYLPRLYVYHAQVGLDSESYSIFNTMERRLLLYITTPAMASSIALGTVLSIMTEAYSFTWFKIKLTCVMLMCVIYGILYKHRKDFLIKNNKQSVFYFKCINELITLLIAIIVLMVVVKPFI